MASTYDNTQPGWVIRIAVGGVLIVMAIAAPLTTYWLWLPMGILAPCYLLFDSLRVTLDDTHIQLSFGIGIIRRRIALADITACDVLTTPWIMGYGIRWVFGEWLWNVSGPWCVRITYTNGKRFRIGTNDPQGLEAAINEAIGDRA